MEQKLCWRCKERLKTWYSQSQSIRASMSFNSFISLWNCSHDKPKEKPKEKCWCEKDELLYMLNESGWPFKYFKPKFCPECGKKLLNKGD